MTLPPTKVAKKEATSDKCELLEIARRADCAPVRIAGRAAVADDVLARRLATTTTVGGLESKRTTLERPVVGGLN